VKELLEYALQDVGDSDMVGITIQNQVNQIDKPIGISFRRKDRLSGMVIWSVFEKVSQSNSRFNTSSANAASLPESAKGGQFDRRWPCGLLPFNLYHAKWGR